MIDEGAGWLASLWMTDPGVVTAVAAGLVVAVVAGVAWVVTRLARSGRLNAKLQIGTAIVQTGMTAAVVSGTYEFCHRVLELPEWEALAFGIFLEASTWVAVGKILEHARGTDDQGRPNTGMGYGGVFFWLFSIVGGFLAVIAGDSLGEMVGRAAIMIVGTGLWFLTLLSRTRPGRLGRRILIALGALHADDVDVPDEHREWQIRRLTRAIRWSNSRGPLRWLGRRSLTVRAEQTSEDVIEAARRRYAVAHLMVAQVRPDSEVMRGVLADVRDDVSPSRRAQLEQERAEIEAERAEVARERAALDAARQTTRTRTAVPTKTVPPAGGAHRSPAGGDNHLPDDVALLAKAVKFVAAAIMAGENYGRRPFGEAVGVPRNSPKIAVPHTAACIHLGADVSRVPDAVQDQARDLLAAARGVLDLEALAGRPHVNGHTVLT